MINPGEKFIIEIESAHKDKCADDIYYTIKGLNKEISEYELNKLCKINPHPITVPMKDDADDLIGLKIGDAVEIDGEIYFYNGHYDYVYSEVGFNYCFVKSKKEINTPEERKDMYKPNNDLVIDSRDLNNLKHTYYDQTVRRINNRNIIFGEEEQ